MTTFTLPADVTQVLGYTRPNGDNVLVTEKGVVRYSLTGAFQARLSEGDEYDSVVSALDGRTEVVSGNSGGAVVSNVGIMVRWLPVPGTGGACTPVCWWNTTDALVTCVNGNQSGKQVWVVPVSGVVAHGPDRGPQSR